MELLTIVNAAANCVVAGAVVDLALRVFGRPDHPIHKHPTAFYSRKFVSSVVICGAVLNVITLSTPSWTEVLLNVGFSLNYIWSSYYDRIANPKHSNRSSKVHKRNASRGTASAAKAKPRSAPRRK
jgi:hypothetical protein